MMPKTSFRVEGPPYPHDIPYYETEAVAWFSENTTKALPWRSNSDSVNLVRKFYAAGATRVQVVVERADHQIPLVRALQVYLPVGDTTKRASLIALARTESQLEARPHMEIKEVAERVHRDEAELADSDSPGPVSVFWEVT